MQLPQWLNRFKKTDLESTENLEKALPLQHFTKDDIDNTFKTITGISFGGWFWQSYTIVKKTDLYYMVEVEFSNEVNNETSYEWWYFYRYPFGDTAPEHDALENNTTMTVPIVKNRE